METIRISGESLARFNHDKNVVTADVASTKKLRQLREGEYFKLSANGRVYVRGYYERSEKKYECYLYDDVNHETFLSGKREVIVDFDF